MANQKHLKILKQGVEAWNAWRKRNPNIRPDLSDTVLDAKSLSLIDFSNADLSDIDLSYSDLSRANLDNADLFCANLRSTNLSHTNLSNAFLDAAQAVGTNFSNAIFTGACIQDWNINAQTNLQGAVCDYIYLKFDLEKQEFSDRRPHNTEKIFDPGDFAKLVQKALNSVDLIFREELNWRSFAYSFRHLEVQYREEQVAIHSIENQGDGTVIVKLAVAPDADKGNIELSFWRGYEMAQKMIAEQYESRLKDKDKHINQLFTLLQQSQEKLGEVPKLMAENSKYDLRGAKFGGGFAADGGTQTGGTFNDFSQNIEQNIHEIGSLIKSLRSKAESFPEAQRTEAIDRLTDLETDLQQLPEKRKPSRIKAALLALVGIATAVSGAVANTNEFVGQVQELSDKLGIPLAIEQVQPQQPKAIEPEQP